MDFSRLSWMWLSGLLFFGITAGHAQLPTPVPQTLVHATTTLFDIRKDFGAIGDGNRDDSIALSRAIAAENTSQTAGKPSCVLLPPGSYRIVSAPPAFVGPGCIKGSGAGVSYIVLDATFSGDLFAWSQAWEGVNVTTAYPFNGSTMQVQTQRAGPRIEGLTIVGNRASPNTQNALMFYDEIDNLFLNDVSIYYLPGQALMSGHPKATAAGFMRESRISNLRIQNAGKQGGAPVVEFYATGSVDTTNEIEVDNVDIYAPYTTGLIIHDTSANPINGMTFRHLRIEGIEGNPTAISTDLLDIGDASLAGNVVNIIMHDLNLIDPYASAAALRVTGQGGNYIPYFITVDGIIGGGIPLGKGLVVEAGRELSFTLQDIHTADTNVTIASSTKVVGAILLNGGPLQSGWTTAIDASVTGLINTPVTSTGGVISSAGFSQPSGAFAVDQYGDVHAGALFTTNQTMDSGWTLIVPTSGSSFQLDSWRPGITLNNPATIASFTFKLPANPQPKQTVTLMTAGAVTALTVATTDGSTISGAPATLPAGGILKLLYWDPSNQWVPGGR